MKEASEECGGAVWEDRLSGEEMAAVGEADGGGHRSRGVGGILRHTVR